MPELPGGLLALCTSITLTVCLATVALLARDPAAHAAAAYVPELYLEGCWYGLYDGIKRVCVAVDPLFNCDPMFEGC